MNLPDPRPLEREGPGVALTARGTKLEGGSPHSPPETQRFIEGGQIWIDHEYLCVDAEIITGVGSSVEYTVGQATACRDKPSQVVGLVETQLKDFGAEQHHNSQDLTSNFLL